MRGTRTINHSRTDAPGARESTTQHGILETGWFTAGNMDCAARHRSREDSPGSDIELYFSKSASANICSSVTKKSDRRFGCAKNGMSRESGIHSCLYSVVYYCTAGMWCSVAM